MSPNAPQTENWKFSDTSSAATLDPIAEKARFNNRRLAGDEVPPLQVSSRTLRDAFTQWGRTGTVREEFADLIPVVNSNTPVPPALVDVAPIPRAANLFRLALLLTETKVVATGLVPLEIHLPLITSFIGGPLAENATTSAEVEFGSLGSIALQTHPYHSGIAWLPNTTLGGTYFDLAGYIQQDLAYAKELGLEIDIANALAADALVTQLVTTASPTAITYAELVSLSRQLPDVYDRLKIIVLSRKAFEAAEDLKGSDGQPMLDRDDDFPDVLRLNGVPVMKTTALSPIAATNVVGLVVSLVGFRLRDTGETKVTRYDEIPTRPDQTGFDVVGYHAFGYDVAAVAKLKMHA